MIFLPTLSVLGNKYENKYNKKIANSYIYTQYQQYGFNTLPYNVISRQ